MTTCNRCNQTVIPQDHAIRRRRLGSPGLHVRRFTCACGVKSVGFFHVMNVSLIRSRDPRPGHVSLIPQNDFPIFQSDLHGNA